VKVNRGSRGPEYVQRVDPTPLHMTTNRKLALVMGRLTAEDAVKSLQNARALCVAFVRGGYAVVNLDQFRITTWTILAKEHFPERVSSSPSSKEPTRMKFKRTHRCSYRSQNDPLISFRAWSGVSITT